MAQNANLVGGGSAASVAPGTILSLFGTNLSAGQTASAPLNAELPRSLGGVEVYINGVWAPLEFVSPNQINVQLRFDFGYANTGTATVWVRIQQPDGTYTNTNSVAISIVPANPGIFAGPGANDPRPATAVHASSYATGVVSVDGTIKAGNVGSICINSTTALTATTGIPTGCTGGTVYNYVVQAGDSLATIQRAFVEIMANDPMVTASPSSEFTRILLQAKVPGTAGNGIPFSVSVSTGADLLLTAIGPSVPSPGTGDMLCCANTAGAPLTVDNPALAGETIIVYATGLGLPSLTPLVDPPSGQPYNGPVGNRPQSFVSSQVNNTTANVLRAELAPGLIGIYQVYLQLSAALTTDRFAELYIAQNTYRSNIVSIPVYATAQLSSVTCTPTSLNTGGTSTCTVTLTVAVPNLSTTITLASNNTGLSVPASVIIPAGSVSVSFAATEVTVSSQQTATLTATLGTASTTTTITLNP